MQDILKVLTGKQACPKPPVWLMRQAGRYLPEYRELRKEKGSFLNLVYSPRDACEVTMQPIRRYSMNGAILFSDILIVPHALGLNLEFKQGEGPVLDTIRNNNDLEKLDTKLKSEKFQSIYETVNLVKNALREEGFDNTTLIGFAGAPWTVACYCIQGHGKTEFPEALKLMRDDFETFQKLLTVLTDSTIEYLRGQADAGAQAIKLFESWANLLSGTEFENFCVKPAGKIRKALKDSHPHIPFIGFAKTENENDLKKYSEIPDLDCMGLSHHTSDDFIKSLPLTLATQGNLDPELLLNGGKEMEKGIKNILRLTANRPHIFNLGHGVIKETSPENVAKLVEMVRA